MEKKQYKLRVLPLFEYDLNEITDYITYRLRNPEAADRLIDAVEAAIYQRLPMAEAFEPYRGSVDRQPPYYWIEVGNFVVFYVVVDSVMEVRRILYKKRNMKKLI